MKTRSLYLLTALIGAVAFTVPWLTRMSAQDSPIGNYSMSEWAHYQLNVNRVLETGQVGKVIGYVSNGVVGVIAGSGGIPEAPLGTLLYARSNAVWQAFPPGLDTMQTDAPDNGLWYSRRNGEWQNFSPTGGSGTNVGGTNRLKLAAMSEFRPPDTNGTILPANTATFIKVNHIYDPDGVITAINTNTGSFRPAAGYYAVTMVVPVSVTETGPGTVRIPFTIALFDLTTTNDVYYQTYTLYDEDLSQYSQVFLPALVTDGTHDFSIRVFNHSATLDLVAGQAGQVAGLDNHYTEIQFLKIDGIAGLEDAPVNTLKYARSNANWVSFTIPSTNGFIPEAPTDGQTYGRRGSDASWQLVTGGGADTNAVASVTTTNDLVTLTGYTKAIVGGFYTGQEPELWQVEPNGLTVDETDNFWMGVSAGGTDVLTWLSPTELQVADNASSDGVTQNGFAVLGSAYRIEVEARMNVTDVWFDSSTQDNEVWLPDNEIGTNWTAYQFTFTANSTNSIRLANVLISDDALYLRNFVVYGPEFTNAYSSTVLPHPDTNYIWRKVGDITLGGGAALTTKTIEIPSANYQFVPDTDVIVINSTVPFTSGDYFLTGQPTILPGVDGQHLTITNISNADLQFTVGEAFGIYARSSPFTIASDIKFDQNYVGYFRFNGPTGQWDAIGGWPIVSGLEITTFPAPWGPPDEDGVQTLSPEVKHALAVELLPYILDRWQTLMPQVLSNAAPKVLIVP